MIELIVFDVDGTLTNGQITYSSNGDEFKSFDVSDGLAIAVWTRNLGKKVAIITGRNSSITEKRAKELNVSHIYQGVKNKLEVLEEILKKESLTLSQVAAIGDDLNDYKMLKNVGLSFTPANGTQYLKDFVNVVCKKRGGEGAAREMIEYIIKKDGMEKEFLNAWV
ncbi:KdsC family phosphatase [Aliarcobacter lanthieri]|uniref:KdsC family phosphatase n=1 Tax=Aliarcobacter lanthieri TaxID=1355374 RepID=UPI00047A9A09|nr:HAD-IIIA family hydrolase [Aliarcobacter lanthieri]QKF59613.1 3-deoxy-D-manno-octulosonate 8-phosphate phosphatase, YrbI family [Aliarcobacter lanthieri]